MYGLRSTISRKAFGAYDPEVWQIQTYLGELGFDPGAIDGLWGDKTASAALTFRNWAGLGPASGLDKAGIVDEGFWTELDRATASAGFDINVVAPSSAPGGAGVSPAVTPPLVGPSVITPGTQRAETLSMILPLGILALGAFIAFGGKKR